jgi:DNA-binding transcriptional ArsR family regulator
MVYQSDQLDATFAALSDPTRRDILRRLSSGTHTISELASRYDVTLMAISKHVRVLERAGLARIQRQGRTRRAALEVKPLRHALEWIDRYRRFWENELDLLAAYLEGTTPSSQSESRELTWPTKPTPRRRSRSGEPSARRSNASTTHGRKRRS